MRVALVVLFVASVAHAGMVPQKVIEYIKTAKYMEACWGEDVIRDWHKDVMDATDKCMMMEPTLTEDQFFNFDHIERVARQAPEEEEESEEEHDEDKMEMFVEAFGKVKEMKIDIMSNLTCVMKELKYWKEDNSVNIDYFLNDMFEGDDYEEEFVSMLKEGYQMCHTMSEAVPVDDIKDPMKKMFGKQLFFQKCLYKTDDSVCAMKEIAKWHDRKFGKFDAEKAAELGLPKSRYHASFMGKMVMLHSKPAPVKFITSLLFTGKKDM